MLQTTVFKKCAIIGIAGHIAPEIFRADFQNMLEQDPFKAFYPDENENKSLSLKKHLELLIRKALEDARQNRSSINKLIFAGGSSKLPKISEWVKDFFTTPTSNYGIPHEGFDEDHDIYTNDPEICVAGGATIHQVYRHHSQKKWRKVITPSLSANFKLIYYRDIYGKEKKLILGEQNSTLPINCTKYHTAKVINNPKPWPEDEKIKIILRIQEQEWEQTCLLPDNFLAQKGFNRLWQAILVYYYIDEFGILQDFQLIPGSVFSSWHLRRKYKRAVINEPDQPDAIFKELQLTNTKRIQQLRKIFIPKNLYF